jgi:hypothetical protein
MKRYGVIIKLFADDSKIYAEILDISDFTRLQTALDALVRWAETWQLKLAINKCCVLNIGRRHVATEIIPSSLLATITISGHGLSVVNHCRDLGVIVADNLQPRLHINAIVAKASQRANAILDCFCDVIPTFCYVLLMFTSDPYSNITVPSGHQH